MSRIIKKIEPLIPKIPSKKRVAAYARVSSGKDSMLHSLSAQISYYSDYIQKHCEWEYIGVYADEAITGTKDRRTEFQRLLTDCREGKIHMVITKSISRFARNTVTMLEAVRELKNLNVDVFFEKENIHSISGDGELMLSILASFAQEESRSVSENCKWRIRNKFKEGIPFSFSIIGYDLKNGQLKVVPHEADIVRMIFNDYLSGMGKNAIMKKLNERGIKTKKGNQWNIAAVDRVLRNEKYVGDLLLQKFFSSNHIEKQKRENTGQLPRYHVKGSHEAIIDRDTFTLVQQKLEENAERFQPQRDVYRTYPFAWKVVCEKCDKNYRRKINNAGTRYEKPVWICSTYNRLGKAACPSQQIPENVLISLVNEVLGIKEFDEVAFERKIKEIRVPGANKVKFIFRDGRIIKKEWQNESRSESWNEEKRQLMRISTLERRSQKCKHQEQ